MASTILVGNLISENSADNFGAGVVGNGRELRSNTIVYNFHKNNLGAAAGVAISSTAPLITKNIIAYNHGPSGRSAGIGIACRDTSPFGRPRLECNNVWGNDGGDYYFPEDAPCDSTGGHNISLDPLFCDPEGGNFGLLTGSPCAEESNPDCGQIGAFGVTCGGTAVEKTTWGRLKQMYD